MKTHINGREIKYDAKAIAEKKESAIIKKIVNTGSKASDRFIKLSHEFKAGDLYKLYNSSHSQESIAPKLDDPFVTEFKQKFNEAAISAGEALRYIKMGNIDTVTLKSLTSSALSDLHTLEKLSIQNISKANSLFEKAYYDTNSEGWASGIVAASTAGLSLFVSQNNTKHEFTDKLGREIEAFNEISSLVSELETYIPHE